MSSVVALPGAILDKLNVEIRAASWFAALGEALTEGDRADARAYADGLALDDHAIAKAHDWPEAERILKAPDWSHEWWDREERLRVALLEHAAGLYPERALWMALTTLTTEVGELVHGKAATAAARMGGAARASVHVAAGAASQAVYQLAVARIAGDVTSPFESKFRLFAAGRWPLGVVGNRLFLF